MPSLFPPSIFPLPPPQPPPAISRLYSQQTYNGFVLTIDGHLTYSPFVDVDPGNPIPGAGGIANWVITNQSYFYNTARTVPAIDRTGSFVKIYNQVTNEPLALAIILNANFAPNTIQIKVIRYEFRKTVSDIDPNFVLLKLRMEDNWKFCSNIPTWIPATAESLNRWIPIMSSDLEPTLGQKLNLKGGVTSVDGISIPLVLDTNYQDNNRLQRLFVEDAVTYQYTNNSLGQIDSDNVSENNLTVQATTISVGDFGSPTTSVPDYTAEYIYYPFLNPSGPELAIPEPWFIDTEAIIATTRTGPTTPPPPAVPTFSYAVQRGIDDSPVTTHGKYSVIFRGMPFPIGQTVKLWEVTNFNQADTQDWFVSYRGMIENIAFSEGLASCTIEISSIAFTARVNAGFATQTTALERRLVPRRRTPDEDLIFYNTFIATQPSFQDTFFWVKIGAICLPLRKLQIIDYEAALNGSFVQEQLQAIYGLQGEEIRGKFERDISSGTTDVGYRIGLEDAFGDPWDISRLFEPDPITYGSVYNARIRNWFNPEGFLLATDPGFLPSNSPWGFYMLDQLPDADKHAMFVNMRRFRSLEPALGFPREDRQVICDYLSSEKPVLVHLFQNFSKGYIQSALPDYARNFFYTGDSSSITTTDQRNFSMETSIIDVILQVLTSTGSGETEVDLATTSYRQVPGINGAWDLIPRELALGVPVDEIDLDSFYRVLNKRGGMNELLVTNIYMEAGKDTPQKFLEEQILKPFFMALATDSRGRVILVDVSDINVGVDTIDIPAALFVRKNGNKTRVNLTYDAADLADSFTYTWKEPFRSNWIDPRFNRVATSSGVSGGSQFRQLDDGERFRIKSKARLFQRIQASPIKYELKYAPISGGERNYEGDRINVQALRYLNRFNRIVPRAKFELFWDYDLSPDIGDVITFNLDAIPNKDGIIGDDTKTIVGKIVDIKVDRRAKTAEYTAILTDTSLAPLDIVWNLTSELVSLATLLTWNITSQEFCIGYNTLRDTAGEIIWVFDFSQFLIGSTIIVWDENWRYITDTTITDVPGLNQIEVASDAGFVAGYRITLETLANSTSQYASFQTWFGEGQKYLF